MLKLKIGQRYGKWNLIEYLGTGGNGTVWKVSDDEGKLGAIKFLVPWSAEDGSDYYDKKRYLRFRDEIAAFCACQDIEGVLPLLDSHTPDVPVNEDPPWLVLELAIPLEEALGDKYSLIDAVEACASIAETLSNMHSQGFWHRDVKPDNLFRFEGRWCLGDFGLADFEGKQANTSANETLGPRFYIADEMLSDARNADGAMADVYSLGKTLWKLGTRQKFPLQGMINAEEEQMRLSTYCNAPGAFQLDTIIEQATRLDPKHRIPMNTFALELRTWLTPSAPTPLSPLSLRHLGPRIEVLQGDFKQRAQVAHQRREQIASKVLTFLQGFEGLFQRRATELKELEFHVKYLPPSQGPNFIWSTEVGDEGMQNGVFFQTHVAAAMHRRGPTVKEVHVIFGVCVRLNAEHSTHGTKYVGETVRAVASVAINQTPNLADQVRLDAASREFVLGGTQVEQVTTQFIRLLEMRSAEATEAAINILESNDPQPPYKRMGDVGYSPYYDET